MEYIDTKTRLAALAERLADEPLIAADTEAAGYHRYSDRACLLQLSTRGDTYVVDVLALDDIDPVAGFLTDRETETVFHDADFDVRLLKRDFDIAIRGLFDSKIAAQFLGEPKLGLDSVLERHLDVRLGKKYQRADWARRPLPEGMLAYAAEDTRHLPALRDRLRERLAAEGRLEWAEEEFRMAETVEWDDEDDDAEPYLDFKGARGLTPRQLGALRDLFQGRDRVARNRDRAPFRILSKKALVELARHMPETAPELADVPGLSSKKIQRYGNGLLTALDRVRALPEKELPRQPAREPRPPRDPEVEARAERLRHVRNDAAETLGLDRGFLMPRHQLEDVAREEPRSAEQLEEIPGVRRWQVEALGQALLTALAGEQAAS